MCIASGGSRKRKGRKNEMRGVRAGVSRNTRDIRGRMVATLRTLPLAAFRRGRHGGVVFAARNTAAIWGGLSTREGARRMSAVAVERARRAVARSGGVWYNSHRCAAMGDKRPATKQEQRDNESLSAPRKRPTASRSISYPFAGCGFASGDKRP